MEDKRYNLRSKKECSISIQLQLASDEDFMAALRPSTGQVSYSEHTDSSNSNIDISDMIANSVHNFCDPVSKNVEGATGQGQGPVDYIYQNDYSVFQNDINR